MTADSTFPDASRTTDENQDPFIPPFEYARRLNSGEFRLLQLQDDQQSRLIRLTVHTTELEHAPNFVALSYTWGNPADTTSILCDGKILKITRNLEAALAQMRNRWCGSMRDKVDDQGVSEGNSEQVQYIWIDAICINQGDMIERTRQVQMMRSIYSAASKVIIWLGPEEETDSMAFAQLSRLNEWGHGAVMLPSFTKLASALEAMGDIDGYQEQLAAADPEHPIWDAIEAVFQRPWFSRCWVIQEYVCASEVEFWVGARVVDEISFITAPLAAGTTAAMRGFKRGSHKSAVYNPFYNISELSRLKEMFQRGGVRTLYEALSVTYGFNATVPLDRVFAVAGLVAKDCLDLTKLIDYTLSLEQLLLAIAKDMVTSNTTGITLLSHIMDSRHRLDGMPSWVPEWKVKGRLYTPIGLAIQHQPDGKQYCHVDDNNTLHTQGRMFDCIEKLTPPPHTTFHQTYNKPGSVYSWVIEVQKLVYTLNKSVNKTTLDKQFQDALVCGHLIEQPSDTPYKAVSEEESELLKTWLDDLHTIAYPYGHLVHRSFDLPIVRQIMRPIKMVVRALTSIIWTASIAALRFSRKQHSQFPLIRKVSYYLRIILLAVIIPCAIIVIYTYKGLSFLLHKSLFLPDTHLNTALSSILEPSWNVVYSVLSRPICVEASLLQASLSSYNTAFNTWSTGRMFCITEQGRFGWVPDSAEKGDMIAALRGSKIPFVLREGKEGSWEVVGDAYIAGAMDGEMLEDGEDGDEKIIIT